MSRRRRFLLPILRPAAGHRLPPELRPGRVVELAGGFAGGLRDPGFLDLLSRIDASVVHPGNRVSIFTDGGLALQAMVEAIDCARSEVLLESYIFRDDAVGRRLAEALVAARERGAVVRVLADAFGSSATRVTFWDALRACGIEVHLYHPVFARVWYQPYRDHRKILVTDRRVGFTGGMNIGEEYGSSRRTRADAWRDTHARVEGPAAWEMAVVFTEGWSRAGGAAFELPPLERLDAPGARVLVLDSLPARGRFESASVLAAIFGAARSSVWITNAYFAPGRPAVEVMAAAVGRGVDVRLLLPGVTDAPIVRHAGHGYFAALLSAGARIFEYQQAVLHAKTIVADGHVSVVGSTNLDFRSFRFNAEANLVVFDDATARRMEAAYRRDLAQAEEITAPAWARRGLPHRLGDRLARGLSPLL